MNEFLNLFYCLGITLIVEVPFMCLFTRKVKWNGIALFTSANFVSNLLAQITSLLIAFYLPGINFYYYFVPIEIVVCAFEFLVYFLFYKNIKIPLFSLIGNLLTILISLVIHLNDSFSTITLIATFSIVLVVNLLSISYYLVVNKYERNKKRSK